MNTESKNSGKENMMAFISIALSVIGVAVSFFLKNGADSFGAGAIITFVAVLASLLSVRDDGKNVLAKIAFFASVAALFIAVGLSAR